MKRTIIAIVGASVLLISALSARAQTVKLGTVAPEGSPWYRIARETGEAWNQITRGKVRLRIYPGGATGDDPDIVRKIRVGQLQAGLLTSQGLNQIVPDVQALQMPLLLTSYRELDYVRDRVTKRLEPLFEARGFKILAWGDAGWVHFFSQKPVVLPEDLKLLRLFAWFGDDTSYVDAWKRAGYNPVPIPATDILTGLRSGLINAFATVPLAALSFQWFGLAKNMTDLNWAPLIGATVISMKTWKEIPEQFRPLLLDSALEAAVRHKPATRKLNEQAVQVMTKHGLIVHPVSPDAFAHWERSARAGYASIIGRAVSAEMVGEVERLRNEFRASQQSN